MFWITSAGNNLLDKMLCYSLLFGRWTALVKACPSPTDGRTESVSFMPKKQCKYENSDRAQRLWKTPQNPKSLPLGSALGTHAAKRSNRLERKYKKTNKNFQISSHNIKLLTCMFLFCHLDQHRASAATILLITKGQWGYESHIKATAS